MTNRSQPTKADLRFSLSIKNGEIESSPPNTTNHQPPTKMQQQQAFAPYRINGDEA
jgi:hypothetical protein